MSSNAYASTGETAPTPAQIDSLVVSAGWKRRFRLIQAGQPAGLNFLALLFGPLYYLAMGMWRQALTFSAINAVIVVTADVCHWLLSSGESHLQLGYLYLLSGAAYAVKANKDYYRKVVLGSRRWL